MWFEDPQHEQSDSNIRVLNRTHHDDDPRRQRLLHSLKAGQKALAEGNKVAGKHSVLKDAEKNPVCHFCKMPFSEETNSLKEDGSWPCSYHPGM